MKISPDVIKMIPPQLMKKYQVVPVEMVDGMLSLAMANPMDQHALEHVRVVVGCEIKPIKVPENNISRILREYLPTLNEKPLMRELTLDPNAISSSRASGNQESQIIRVVNRLIDVAIDNRASDIHLEPQKKALFARLRIDGVLKTIHEFPVAAVPAIISRVKVMAQLDISEKRLPQDGQASIVRDGQIVGLRISSVPCNYGEKVVIRVLDKSRMTLDLAHLGFPEGMLEEVEHLINRPHGLVIVTGPTGTGKSTTLYAMLKRLISNYKNIITLEDPIEYELLAQTPNDLGVTQIQMNNKAGMTFAKGLRAVLRQDPDVIMVGEIRDKETAEITMRASLTGHMVLSTLHTNDAPGTLSRLVEMGIDTYMITSSVVFVLAQRLVRVLCDRCSENYQPTKETLLKFFSSSELDISKAVFRQAIGCHDCHFTGYKGRMPIFELLPMTEAIRHQVQVDATPTKLSQSVRAHGVKNLRDAGLKLVVKGITTFDEVIRNTV